MVTDVANSWGSLFTKSWEWGRFGWKKYAKMGLLLPLSILIVPFFTLVGNWLRLVQTTANGYDKTPAVKYNVEVTKEGFWGFFALLPAYLISIVISYFLGIILGIIVGLLFGFNSTTSFTIVEVVGQILGMVVIFWVMGPIAGVYANERSFREAYATPVSEGLFLSPEYLIGAILYVLLALGTGIALFAFLMIGFLIVPIFIGLGFAICSYRSYFGFVYYRYTTE